MSTFEILGFLSALLYLSLAMRESRWCWPAGAFSSLCYIFVFYDAELYTESLLQLFYIGISWHGFWYWKSGGRNGGSSQSPRIRTMTPIAHVLSIFMCVTLTALLAFSLSFVNRAEYLLADSLVTVVSIFATLLVERKVLENWLYWIVIDLFATGLYTFKGLYLTVALYGIYVVLAVVGYREWRSRFVKQAATTSTGEYAL